MDIYSLPGDLNAESKDSITILSAQTTSNSVKSRITDLIIIWIERRIPERESRKVQIVDYQPAYQQAFKDLNVEWISTYFTMEAADYKALDNPQGYILDNGGYIFVALYEGEPAGVCALLKMDDPEYDYELAKMAVSPRVQGKSIGWLLGSAVIEKARSLGAKKVYLESNTILKPAISLYHKLGFNKVTGHSTPYERCNIQMERIISA